MPTESRNVATPIAFWVERRPDGGWTVETRPARLQRNPRTPSDLPVLTNDASAALESGAVPETLRPFLMDIRDLFALTNPTSQTDEAPSILGELKGDRQARAGAKALAEAWKPTVARFREWHPLLAETVVQVLSGASPAWRAVAETLAETASIALDPSSEPFNASTLLQRVRPAYERPVRREAGDPALAQPIDPEGTAALLGPAGPCAEVIPGYEPRPGQLQMARAVAEAFNQSRHLVVEAGTGIGKSLAYLLPSILWARRNRLPVVVSTNTKNLQTQLFHKDIPALRHVTEAPFSAALVKGRMNYLCLRRLRHILERREAELADDEAVPFAKILAWAAATATGDLDELDRVAASGGGSLRARLACPSEECAGRRCAFHSRCLLQRARALSLSADIIVANHALVFAENGDTSSVFPKYHHLVFDEAHNLEESATRHFSIEITPLRIAIALRRLWRAGKSGGTGALSDLRIALQQAGQSLPAEVADPLFEAASDAILAADRVRSCGEEAFRALGGLVPRGGEPLRYRAEDLSRPAWEKPCETLASLAEALGTLSEKTEFVRHSAAAILEPSLTPPPNLPQWEEVVRGLTASSAAIAELQTDLAFATAGSDVDTVFWVEAVSLARRERRGDVAAALHAAPVDISQRLADTLFATKNSVVLCSATLSVNGSFSFLSRRIGLDRLEPGSLLTCQAPSPFDYASQCHAGAALFLPDPSDPAYVPALADFLVDLFRHTRGRALVLFTSYEVMRTCAKALAPRLSGAGIPLLVQGSGASRDRLTRSFRRDIASVLLGTDSFWEGVDVVGESLSCVVLARLPFDSIGDPLVSARAERVRAEGGDAFFGYSLPNAVIKFRQGFGRLVRHRGDRGLVVVTDRRIFSKGYGVHFRRNLPCVLRGHADAESLYRAAEPFL